MLNTGNARGLLPVSELVERLSYRPAGGIGGVVVSCDSPGSPNRVAGDFGCLLARFGVRGGLLSDVIYDLAKDRHRHTLAKLKALRQARNVPEGPRADIPQASRRFCRLPRDYARISFKNSFAKRGAK